MKIYYEICRVDNGYNGYAPHFPGFMAAGETLEETREKLLSGLKLHIQSMVDDGDVLPPEAVESGHTTIEIQEAAVQNA